MTATINKTYDVFVSHAMADSRIAAEVAAGLELAGLATFYSGTLEPGEDYSDEIWQALAESRALISIVSPDAVTNARGMVEIGAAATWNKPIFVLLSGPSSTRLPATLSHYPVYPISRLEELIGAIRSSFEPLTSDERTTLAGIYQDVNTPADQLNESPETLGELTAKFNRVARKHLSSERLLSEIMRMRKKGELPRLGPAKPTNPKSSSMKGRPQSGRTRNGKPGA